MFVHDDHTHMCGLLPSVTAHRPRTKGESCSADFLMACSSLESFTVTQLIRLHWITFFPLTVSFSSLPAHRGLAGYCVWTHPKVGGHNEPAAASRQLADHTGRLTEFHEERQVLLQEAERRFAAPSDWTKAAEMRWGAGVKDFMTKCRFWCQSWFSLHV